MKKTLHLCAIALISFSANAQTDYHGFDINASQQLIDNQLRGTLPVEVYRLNKALTLQVLYQPEYLPIMADEDLTSYTPGTTTGLVDGAFTDFAGQNGKYEVNASLESGLIDGMVLKSVMDNNGLAYVVIPDKYYKNGELIDVPSTGGDIRVRFFMESNDKGRINDTEACHTEDITGVYLTVDAPSTVTITNNFVQANTSTKFDGNKMDSGTTDQLGAVQRTATFSLPSTDGNGPQDITFEGKASNCWNLFTYKRISDSYAFPISCVDIVFKGVKPGERIGWTNYQTLHQGYTPRKYGSTSGIDNIGNDESDEPVVYYNMQGVRVDNPTSGLYIMRTGSNSKKVVF
ncbi:hypothetical protein [uncultured Muribaculum sp.]|uniref:hypothetical protein n=1 Tax=uncultured Muribaculum sp. TaxID=1918613 RepID=UPI0026707DC5|nr:hypothetical protein [uncultured Muribaculum sp.]